MWLIPLVATGIAAVFAGMLGWTTRNSVKLPNRVTAAKSLTASYGGFFIRYGTAECAELVVISSVYPSGAERAT